ncbi:MAG: hypothetical protein NVSMB63_00880 [Sediminibacterium sp.]
MKAAAQQVNGETFQQEYQLHITKATGPVKIDGEFTEPDWATAGTANNFWRKFPNDVGRPKRKTEVRVMYDDTFIYFGFTSYDSGKAYIQSLKRDIGHDGNDGVGIILDPTNQRTNGFFFVVNAYNAQSEDQLPFADNGPPAWSWDNKWYSATKRYADKWTAEIAIPFKSIRYTAGKLLWGLNFVRIDTKTNEYATWTHIPVNFRSMDLGYTGALLWKEPPPQPGSNMVFIPYVTGQLTADQENGVPTKAGLNAGFDGKVALSSSLNLDLTVNPDFSQVEVDQQVTNLSRFSIFFPERRNFFLENSDLFSQYGIPPIRPFYSRTIGLDKDGNKIPILLGARLSGNITKSTRIGLMNIQTGRKGNYSPENYTAASVSQKVLKRSVIKAYFLNRQNFLPDSAKIKDPLNVFGRNAGLEFNYNNLKGTWGAWAAYHHSFKPGISTDNHFIDAGFNYNGRNISFMVDAGTLGTNYYTDMGYVERINNHDAVMDTTIRLGFRQVFNQQSYKLFPTKGFVATYAFNLANFLVFNPDNSLSERSHEFEYDMQLKNTGFFFLFANANEVNLLFPSSFTDAQPLPRGNYTYQQTGIGYQSDFRKPVSFFVRLAGGGFYNGNYQSVRTTITLRKQPHLNIALQAEYNKLNFPDPYGSNELFLVAPRVELNFTTNLFWTTFVQYNTQRNNFNINSRLQYRFKPMSDFFLVYTDNYFTDPLFRNKNRAIVFKMNYWLNL